MRSNVFPVSIIVVFGLLGLVALVGCFWNIWQLATATICAIMVIAGFKDLKK